MKDRSTSRPPGWERQRCIILIFPFSQGCACSGDGPTFLVTRTSGGQASVMVSVMLGAMVEGPFVMGNVLGMEEEVFFWRDDVRVWGCCWSLGGLIQKRRIYWGGLGVAASQYFLQVGLGN